MKDFTAEITTEMRGQLSPAAALEFLFAGRAVVTVENTTTGGRQTYKVAAPRVQRDPAKPAFFVRVAARGGTYLFAGTIFDKSRFAYSNRAAEIPADAPEVRGFTWVLDRLVAGTLPATVTVWHEGACGRCGRRLTVPSSIESGYGPDCLSIILSRAA